ncbi:MAG TPA: radical SAM family heme chaperone HemW [Candidatus Limnocylindrales bacterium]|nr:radical SAM family heme chaperone HemW [Candidatus Limnocylindrales bacterium]
MSAARQPSTVSPVGLYVHFPLCLSVCPYCDFVVAGGSAARGPGSLVDRFAEALQLEVQLRSTGPPATQPLSSIYIGGGTPSLLSAPQVERLLATVDRSFGISPRAEVTIEVNPGPGERGDLAGLRAAGVNRLSVGAQTFAPDELRRLGRRHTPGDIEATATAARRAGFENISLDLLYDVPGQTVESWRRTLARSLALVPEHISAYALSLDDPDAEGLTGAGGDHLPLRRGARRWREEARRAQDEDRAADMYEMADEVLERAGLRWYEISNWARPGSESRHNLNYWHGGAWEAVGPGAHAFDGLRTRRWNAARLDFYLSAVEAGKPPPGGREVADPLTADVERAILQLRTVKGLSPIDAPSGPAASAIAWGLRTGLLARAGDRVRLTRRGRLLSSELFTRMLVDSQRERAGALAPAPALEAACS